MKTDLPREVECPVDATLRLLSGKWRLLVLFNLEAQPLRWGELRRRLAPITPRVLTATLRSLEVDRMIWREVEGTIPPQVTYGLTSKGDDLAPVFKAMGKWGAEHLQESRGT
ncbi:MAG: helix-turn-helix domain-containing protein [Pseudomonadota bacterium]